MPAAAQRSLVSPVSLEPMEESLDAATSRLLMKKTWCHGQIIAAFQGVLYALWGYEGSNLPQLWRSVLMSSMAILPLWSLLSWRAMSARKAIFGWMILGFGVLLLPFYGLVIWMAVQDSSNPYQLALIILTGLQCMETCGYLLVVACLKDSLVTDATEPEDQYHML